MLVLSRDEGESLQIGDDIKITVIRTGRKVRLGIEAPPDVPVWRSELQRFGKAAHSPSSQSSSPV